MLAQSIQAPNLRRDLILEAIKNLSGQAHRWVSMNEIVESLKEQGHAIGVYDIRRDLRELLLLHPQLERNHSSKVNGRRYGYRWLGEVGGANGLSMPEAFSLVMVGHYIKQLLPLLWTKPLTDVFSKAQQALELCKTNQASLWLDKMYVVQQPPVLIPPAIDQMILTTVHEALFNAKQLKVAYQLTTQPTPEIQELHLHPLGLIQRGPVCWLVAMAGDYDDVFLYALHRMQSVEKLALNARQIEGFKLSDFAKTQAFFGKGEMIEFKARLCEHLALMLSETPLTESQHISEPDDAGNCVISATLPNTWQLRWWILGEGERIEVLQPVELRQEIARTLREAGRHYSTVT